MTRLGFFALLVSCASSTAQPTTVEIAQPLPTVAVTATPTADPPSTVTFTDPLEIEGLRDPRRTLPRSRTLLAMETAQLTQLLAATSQASPDRPALMRRMAENYVELRKQHVESAGPKAIETYRHLADQYPAYAQADEVLYYLGLEYEIAGDMPHARRTQYDLISRYPTSSLIAYSYFAFGEMFMEDARTDDTKLALAEQSYQEVVKLQSPITGLAACRLVRIAKRRRDEAQVLSLQQRYGKCGA